MNLERHWYGPRAWLWLLWPLQFIFCLLTSIRRRLYLHGFLPRYRAPVPVIVVGNISVGGTGKTPLTIAIIEHLQAKHRRVGVVSRGYGAHAPLYPHVVTEKSLTSHCGDEPFLIFKRTNAVVVVDPNRSRAIKRAVAMGCDVVISDDGLQHYAFARDVEIVVIDAVRQLGNRWLLPAGPLREPVSRLGTVDLLICNGDAIPMFSEHVMRLEFNEWLPLNESMCEINLSSALSENKTIQAFAGIGNPSRFFSQLRQAGWDNIVEHPFNDHHQYVLADFEGISGLILMTEKDAVKCRDLPLRNAWYVPVKAKINGEFFHSLDQKLLNMSGGKHDG